VITALRRRRELRAVVLAGEQARSADGTANGNKDTALTPRSDPGTGCGRREMRALIGARRWFPAVDPAATQSAGNIQWAAYWGLFQQDPFLSAEIPVPICLSGLQRARGTGGAGKRAEAARHRRSVRLRARTTRGLNRSVTTRKPVCRPAAAARSENRSDVRAGRTGAKRVVVY